ncbi:hypothetical protein D3C72_1990670 [compost metagenome]
MVRFTLQTRHQANLGKAVAQSCRQGEQQQAIEALLLEHQNEAAGHQQHAEEEPPLQIDVLRAWQATGDARTDQLAAGPYRQHQAQRGAGRLGRQQPGNDRKADVVRGTAQGVGHGQHQHRGNHRRTA